MTFAAAAILFVAGALLWLLVRHRSTQPLTDLESVEPSPDAVSPIDGDVPKGVQPTNSETESWEQAGDEEVPTPSLALPRKSKRLLDAIGYWYQRIDDSPRSSIVVISLAIGTLILGLRTGGVLGGIAKVLAIFGFFVSFTDAALRLAHRRNERSLRQSIASAALLLSLITWFVAHVLPHGPQWVMSGSYTLRLECSSGCNPGTSSNVLINMFDMGTDGQVKGRAQLGYTRIPLALGALNTPDPLAPPPGFTPFGDTSAPLESDNWDLSGSELGNELTFDVWAPLGWWTFKGTIARDGTFGGTARYWTGRWTAIAFTTSGHAAPLPGWIYWFD